MTDVTSAAKSLGISLTWNVTFEDVLDLIVHEHSIAAAGAV